MSLTCTLAAMICACTGISGGMVLGPLFLKYNMHPQIMPGTNQYIAMIASLAVFMQFIYLGNVDVKYTIYYGIISIWGAYVGIKIANRYTQRKGK